MTDEAHIDTTTEQPAADAPRVYGAGIEGLREAADDHRKSRDEAAASAVTPDQVADADREHHKRVAERMGAEAVDLNKVVLTDKEPTTARKAARALSDFHASRERELAEIVGEQQQDRELDRQLIELEEERRAEQAQERQQTAAEQQRVTAEQAQRQITAAEQELAVAQRRIEQAATARFPELPQFVALAQQDPAAAQRALQEWAAANPARASELAQMDAAWRQAQQQSASIAQHRQAQQQSEFQNYGKAEDEKFAASHPELADSKVLRAWQDDAVAMFEERGIPRDRLAQLWTNDPNLRSVVGQELIYAAVKQWRGERAMKDLNSHRAPPPPVQRPGTRIGPLNGQGNGSAIDPQRLRGLSGQAALRAGVRQMQALRRGR
jgi:hypothetical protein